MASPAAASNPRTSSIELSSSEPSIAAAPLEPVPARCRVVGRSDRSTLPSGRLRVAGTSATMYRWIRASSKGRDAAPQRTWPAIRHQDAVRGPVPAAGHAANETARGIDSRAPSLTHFLPPATTPKNRQNLPMPPPGATRSFVHEHGRWVFRRPLLRFLGGAGRLQTRRCTPAGDGLVVPDAVRVGPSHPSPTADRTFPTADRTWASPRPNF